MDIEPRAIATLQFFDLQSLPLTLYEVYAFLITTSPGTEPVVEVPLSVVVTALSSLHAAGRVEEQQGYYFLPGKSAHVAQRLSGYRYGIVRERRIRRFKRWLPHVPFVRGVALAGSQALGLQREQSDIDLLVITDSRYMWLARTLLTGLVHLAGVRRYGAHIANRVCLNHYVAGPHLITHTRNFYTAAEYAKLRPLYNSAEVAHFQNENLGWIAGFFPNQKAILAPLPEPEKPSRFQKAIEWIFELTIGKSLEAWLGRVQAKRIRIQKDIVVANDELSFHPNSKQDGLLARFHALQEQE